MTDHILVGERLGLETARDLIREVRHSRSIVVVILSYDARLMRSYPVSTRINHAANDDEERSRPVEVAHTKDNLFS